jgi:hypothetical protein
LGGHGLYDITCARNILIKYESYSEEGYMKLFKEYYYEFASYICSMSHWIINKSNVNRLYSSLNKHIFENNLNINENEYIQITFIFTSFENIEIKNWDYYLNEPIYSIEKIAELFALSDINLSILIEEGNRIMNIVTLDSNKICLSVMQYARILSKMNYLNDANQRFNLLKPLIV